VGLFGNFFAELFANLGDVVVDAHGARQGDLITTIDPVVQEKLDQVLAEVNAQYGSSETGGIIMDPKTPANQGGAELVRLQPNRDRAGSCLLGERNILHCIPPHIESSEYRATPWSAENRQK
jgi:hypothetical protein